MKPTVATILTNAVMVLPSLAGEPGKIFDFNLTLPIIASEFLLLMVILDKTVFGPVGKALDDRDALIRSQLAAVGDNSTEVANLIVSVPPYPSPWKCCSSTATGEEKFLRSKFSRKCQRQF